MLYTKKGDAGTTGLFGVRERVSKYSPVTEALGALDEANSYLGLCRAEMKGGAPLVVTMGKRKKPALTIIHEVQNTLFSIQAEVAGAPKKAHRANVRSLEAATDAIERSLPPMHAFSIPGGTRLSAHFDLARTLVRKAERRVVAVHEGGVGKVSGTTLAYLNRLSSLLFALARYANHVEGVCEEAPSYK